MSDIPPSYVSIQSVVVCEVCESSTDVRWYCTNCQGSLCDTCKETHQDTAISRKHSVVNRTGEVLRLHGPAKIAEPCQKHTSKDISTYCNRCQVACCVSCLAESHNGHNISTIEDAYLSAEKRLNDYIRELDKGVKGELDDMATQTYATNADLVHHIQKAKGDVNAFRTEMKQAVDSSCDALIDELESPSTELSNIVKNIEIYKQNVDELINQCTERIREGKLDMIKYTPPTPTSLILKVTLPPLMIPLFVSNNTILENLKHEVGIIQYKEAIKPKPDQNLDVTVINVKKISSFNAKIGATSITVVDHNTAWIVDYGSDTMYLYDRKGAVVRSSTVDKGKSINDMCVSSSGEMIVTNRDKKVRCVSKNGKMSTLIDTKPYDAEGVCLTDRGEIVVCMRGQNDSNHVTVYSSDGNQMLRKFRGKNTQGRHITDPYRVVQNGENLCVVNYCRSVVCVDKRGRMRWVYDGTQAKLDVEFNPCGICRDKNHSLLVTDNKNHCVHYIDREGRLIQVILTKEQIGLWGRWGISVDDETRQVWVGGSVSKDVVVATYLRKD